MRVRLRILAAVAVAGFAALGLQGMQNLEDVIQPVAKVNFRPIDEMSGLVSSRSVQGGFWTHNDSGDSARFFCIRRDGSVVQPEGVTNYQGIALEGAVNVDWEDVAREGNRLYLCDVGNNANERRDLKVYEVREPDATKVTRVKPVATYPVAYEDQTEFPPSGKLQFDCEAVFSLRGKLFFVTKHRANRLMPDISAKLYRMDTRYTDRVNVLKKVDERANIGGWVTAADVSPDGRTIAVLSQAPRQGVWLFDAKAKGDRFLSAPGARFIPFTGAKQCEAVAFEDNERLLVSNEQRDIYEINTRQAKASVAARIFHRIVRK